MLRPAVVPVISMSRNNISFTNNKLFQICFISFAVGGVVAMLCERKLHRIVDQVGGRLPMNRYRIAGFFFTLSALFFVLSVIFCFR